MSKKRLSDLLREESEELPNQDTPNNNHITVEAKEDSAAENNSKAAQPAAQTRSRRSKTNYEKTIAELKNVIEQVNEQTNDLQNQVGSLQSELQTQKDLVTNLSNQLQQVKEIQEANQAQKTEIEKLQTDLQQFKQSQTELEERQQFLQKAYTQLQQAQAESTQKPTQQAQTEQVSLVRRSARPPRPIGGSIVNQQSSQGLSKEEVGWFD